MNKRISLIGCVSLSICFQLLAHDGGYLPAGVQRKTDDTNVFGGQDCKESKKHTCTPLFVFDCFGFCDTWIVPPGGSEPVEYCNIGLEDRDWTNTFWWTCEVAANGAHNCTTEQQVNCYAEYQCNNSACDHDQDMISCPSGTLKRGKDWHSERKAINAGCTTGG